MKSFPNVVSFSCEEKKTCNTCGVEKPIAGFYKHKDFKDGRRVKCSSCTQKAGAEYRKKNKEKFKFYKIKASYGLSAEDYNKMFAAQKGCCKTCGAHTSTVDRGLCVDHEHKTGKVRGLLCNNCNMAIGKVKENVEVLQNIIQYLRG